MKTSERINMLTGIFNELRRTTSMLVKQSIVRNIPPVIKSDFEFCLEILNGTHKLGYTYQRVNLECSDDMHLSDNSTIEEVYKYLQTPLRVGDLSNLNIVYYCRRTSKWAEFLLPLVNRVLRLGIGKSLLPTGELTPMLAKKYENLRTKATFNMNTYTVTEKLDGNRCLAHFDGVKWNFTSRSGKPMKVNFDMSHLPTDMIFDGEILSPGQVALSNNIHKNVKEMCICSKSTDDLFSETSGLINSKSTNKNLIYNVFDVVESKVPYIDRRKYLNTLQQTSDNVRILPELFEGRLCDSTTEIDKILEVVIASGGEGIMLNRNYGMYEQKRTNDLLKYKPVYTMDMIVTDILLGSGKYEGMVGALEATCLLNNGDVISCKIGTGLSDDDRLSWATCPTLIIGKIIEVGYFSKSQSSDMRGTKYYSLRFPRLKRVRYDKTTTSEY